MISFFKEKSAAAFFGVAILSIATRAFFWVHPAQIIASPNEGLLYYLLNNFSSLQSSVISLLYHTIIIVQAMRFNYLLADNKMFTKPAVTTAAAYILITALVPVWSNITIALIANSMITWLLFCLFKLYNTSSPKTLLYNAGLITGCTMLMYYAAYPLLLIAFFALAIIRPFRINEWITLLLGIITPFYFLAGWLYLNDKLDIALQQLSMFQLYFRMPHQFAPEFIAAGAALFALIAGIILWQNNSGRMIVQVRKNWSVLFGMLVLFVPSAFFLKDAIPTALLLTALPAAAFVSNTFLYPRTEFLPRLIFWLLLAAGVYVNWRGILF